jgi:hypothetical protein
VKTTDPVELPLLARGLAALTGRMEAAPASKLCAGAAARAIDLVPLAEPALRWQGSSGWLPALVDRLDRADARALAGRLVTGLPEPDSPHRLHAVAEGLAALSVKLEARQAQALCAPIATRLANALAGGTDDTDTDGLALLVRGLEVLAVRLEPRTAHELAAQLAAARGKTSSVLARLFQAQGLAALAGQLDPKDAQALAVKLAAGVAKAAEPGELGSLARALTALTGRLDQGAASLLTAGAGRRMSRALQRTNWQNLGKELSLLAARLDPTTAKALAAELAVRVRTAEDAGELSGPAEALAALAGRLAPGEARRLCLPAAGKLVDALEQTPDSASPLLASLAEALAALAGRLEAGAAGKLCGGAAAKLLRAQEKTSDPAAREKLLLALAALSARLDGKAVRALAPRVIDALARSGGPTRPLVAEQWQVRWQLLADRLDVQQAVDLLKHPACVGAPRAALLRSLGKRCGRSFASVWDLVEWLQKNEPGIDLSPPRKPAP